MWIDKFLILVNWIAKLNVYWELYATNCNYQIKTDCKFAWLFFCSLITWFVILGCFSVILSTAILFAFFQSISEKQRFNCNVCSFITKWYFVTKIVLTYCEKKIVLAIEKNFWNSRLKAENLQNFEITTTIYSNSERSEQFLVTECFLNLFLEVSHIYLLN